MGKPLEQKVWVAAPLPPKPPTLAIREGLEEHRPGGWGSCAHLTHAGTNEPLDQPVTAVPRERGSSPGVSCMVGAVDREGAGPTSPSPGPWPGVSVPAAAEG